MKTIPLTKGLVALVDDEDYERVNQHKWTPSYSKAKSTPYKYSPYVRRAVQRNGKITKIYLHRFLMDAPKGLQVDHIDGNSLNNQKSNLRMCKHRQNQMNMKQHNKHGFKGVVLDQRIRSKSKPWKSQIKVNRINRGLGNYRSKIDAAIAYNIAAVKYFGEFARLNPIPFVNAGC